MRSLPLRKCGLKYDRNEGCNQWGQVTSLAEVWIEILFAQSIHYLITVTSLAEVWIEMPSSGSSSPLSPSLPLRKCGLKFGRVGGNCKDGFVTSLAEVWIEICIYKRESAGG